ncbi:MAG TPA: GtrA family protein [Terriglobia bacterium]|nr:GtrA family protein [Terriglobia bacterium]
MTATLGVSSRSASKRSADLPVGVCVVSPCADLRISATAQVRRWLAFNLVGGFGIVVQLSTLAALTAGVGLHYLLASGLAVEVAVLHNFIWHERWTWRDRAGQDKPGWWKRLLRFQIANGALSVGGNLLLMQLLVGTWAMNHTIANVVCIALCSVLNFLAGDRLVFPQTRRS